MATTPWTTLTEGSGEENDITVGVVTPSTQSQHGCRLERTHVVDVLAGRGAGGGHDGGAVRHVIVMSGRLHLHVAALGVFAHSGGVVDGGVWVFTVEGAGAGQGALGVIYKHTQQADLLPR